MNGSGSKVRAHARVVLHTPRLTSCPAHSPRLPPLRSALETEGPRFIFRGWLPAWARLQPTTILTFVFLERCVLRFASPPFAYPTLER